MHEDVVVLIAHPDAAARAELSKLLVDEGIVSIEAHEGGRALDAVRRMQPALVVIDLRLSRPDGLSVVRRLLSRGEVAVLVLDSTGDEKRAAELLREGCVDVCDGMKRRAELVARIRARLDSIQAPPSRSLGTRTEPRALESVDSLVTAPGFVERLVDCAGDAIIAADRKGTLLLFNRAAERITGYRAEEVVGQMNVASIYPSGVAREVMKKLRAPSHGGVGKAGPIDAEILSKEGLPIPIHLHASLLYEDGVEIASVGFFTDLRARREIEQKLKQAQEQLIQAEKQAAAFLKPLINQIPICSTGFMRDFKLELLLNTSLLPSRE